MKIYEACSLAGIYKVIRHDVINAKEIHPRGLATKEIIAPQLIIHNPTENVAYHKDRKFSTKFALAESMLLFDSTSDVKYFSKFNKNIVQFSDDGEHLYGSYGYRIADYIAPIVKKLKTDPASRQIILPILRIEDVIKDTKDIPCTLTFQLLLRDDKLNMIVNMRSNDIIWGLPYDVFSFTNFQQVIANELGVKLGWYCHRPGSFHIYSTHYELFEKISNDFTSKSFTHDYTLQEWINIKNNYKDMVDGAANSELFETIHSKVK